MKIKYLKLAQFPRDPELILAWLKWKWGMQKLEPGLKAVGLKWKLHAEYIWMEIQCIVMSVQSANRGGTSGLLICIQGGHLTPLLAG